MKCKKCYSEINIVEAVRSAKYSWPEWSAFLFECQNCSVSNHIKVLSNKVQVIDNITMCAADYDVLYEENHKSISFRADPAFLHIWIDNTHFEIKARE